MVVDARMLADGGIGTYLRNLIPRVAAARPDWRFTALVQRPTGPASRWAAAIPNLTLQSCRARIYGLREQVEVPLRTPADATVFWAPHYNFPLFTSLPLVVTIHDVCHIALAELNGGPLQTLYARRMLSAVRARARGVLFVSEFSRSEMTRLVGPCETNVAVAHLAPDDHWWAAKVDAAKRPIAEPYLLYVGNLKVHKNVPALLQAHRDAGARLPHRLVVLGRATGLRADPRVETSSDARVLFTGEVSDERLRQFMAHADAFVTASRYEGFGLPALEAMAAGVPCLVSAAGSFSEVCGDAALYCDPADTTSITAGLVRIATDQALRRSLIDRGLRRAHEFSWDRCTATTVSVLERALA